MSETLATALPVAEAIRQRRTIYEFAPAPVPAVAQIQAAADLARWAPTHGITEPWRMYFVGPETHAKLADLAYQFVAQSQNDLAKAQAMHAKYSQRPGMFVLTCVRTPGNPVREREDYGSTCIFAHNLGLVLWTQNIGLHWSSGQITRLIAFYELIGLNPEVEDVVGLFTYGIPQQVPRSVRRKAVADFTTELP